MNKIPMTATGAKLLEQELHELKSIERPKIIEAIAEARAHGDLRENAEYHEAKRQQSFIEGRILEIESKLSNAHIIDVTKIPNTGKVIFGTTVHLINTETDEEVIYQIVGEDEADLKAGKISVTSPIARAVIGKKEGDVINAQTPAGVIEYELLKVKYI